jgi:lactoylglutathione lyase
MMKIAHIALWVNDLEKMRDFYCNYFQAIAGKNYHNPEKHFESCFLKFESGISIELLHKTNQILPLRTEEIITGFHHFAFSVENQEKVEKLTSILGAAGYKIKSNPRVTGDGYYESVVTDPEGNIIEITV